MKLWSHSWINGGSLPERCAAARLDAQGQVVVSGNHNPHLAWDEVPAGTLSFAVIAHDFDVPVRLDLREAPGREISEDLPRIDFFHWLLVDLPPTRREIAEGEFAQQFLARGQPGPRTVGGARHGLNDYSSALQGHPELAGQYYGYDGPWPPAEDALVHHYAFTLYALDVARAPVSDPFTGHELRRAVYPHALAEATLSGTYSLNPRHRR